MHATSSMITKNIKKTHKNDYRLRYRVSCTLEWVRDMNKYRYDSDHQAHFGKHEYISEPQKEHIWARMLRTDLVFRIWGIWHTNELLAIQRIQELNPFWSALPLSLHCHIPNSFQSQLFEIMHVQISLETCWNQIISTYACHCETLCLLAYLSENSVTITTINLTPQNEYAGDCRETSEFYFF